MKAYPLAVYTADHGLFWNYPKDEIPFLELDACRKAFGQLPDFGSGAKGFDGIWAKGSRVFVMRCQSVSSWDFRGRSATYLAVTWIPRCDAAGTDFEKLLESEAMSVPVKAPSMFFNADAATIPQPGSVPPPPEPYLPDGFVRAGAIVAGAPDAAVVAIKRISGNKHASLSITGDIPLDGRKPEPDRFDGPDRVPQTVPHTAPGAALIAIAAVCFASVAAAAFLWVKWLAAERKIAELEKCGNELRESKMAPPCPHCEMPFRVLFFHDALYHSGPCTSGQH